MTRHDDLDDGCVLGSGWVEAGRHGDLSRSGCGPRSVATGTGFLRTYYLPTADLLVPTSYLAAVGAGLWVLHDLDLTARELS